MQFQRCSSVLHTSREGIACEIGGTARFVLECRSSGCQIAAWPASSRGVRAAVFALWLGHRRPPCTEAAPPGSAVPDAGAIWGVCTIRSLSSACRRRVAALMVQFPPFGGGFAPLGAFLRRVAGVSRLYWRNSPHPLLQQEDGVRRVAPLMVQFPPVWWGFCTSRSLSSACRRRVAALMAQFPPSAAPAGGRSPASRASNGAIPPVCWQ